MSEQQICDRCIMDTTDPLIVFDSNGVCNYCELHDKLEKEYPLNAVGERNRNTIVNEIKRKGKNSKYDCVIGVSGGTDSTYQLHLSKKLDLRPLVIHFDNGWDSEIAVTNIKNATSILGYDLFTYVVDWEEFKDIQIAFLKASTPDSEIPTDIAIQATLYKIASQEKIKYLINGHSFRTEGKVPLMWSYGDGRYIKGVYKKFGNGRLKTFPNLTFFDLIHYSYIKRIKEFRLLYYFPYNKDQIKKVLKKELNWQDYGGHHYESIYTRFYQGYILPVKFNIDKRKREFSALIRSGQMNRDDALRIIDEIPPLPPEQAKADKEYVIKKLGLSPLEFEEIMALPPKTFLDYPNYFNTVQKNRKLVKLFYKVVSHSIPPILYQMDQMEDLRN